MSDKKRKKKAAIFCRSKENVDRVYAQGRRERLQQLTDMYPLIIGDDNFDTNAEAMKEVEVIFSTWGMLLLDEQRLAQMPALEAVFYAAGSVRGFAKPLLERGIVVSSARGANGVPVAEFTLAQILLSMKRYFANARDCRDPERFHSRQFATGPGCFGETVAILGAGVIGRQVIELLRPFMLRIVVWDPFLAADKAEALGVTLVSLEEAFSQAYVVSNHLANVPETQGLLDEPLFKSMRKGATFINTGRGAQVDEAGLIRVLQERSDLMALLDVTDPEPPAKDSPFFTLPNVQLSAHIAGSMGDEVVRMADFMIDEFWSWLQGRPLQWEVTKENFDTLA